MPMRLFQIDTLLATPVYPVTGDTIQWREMACQEIDGQRRWYYAAEPPWRIVLVLRGQPITASFWVPSGIVHGLVGWEEGTPEFVLPANQGRRHTKLTLLAEPPGVIYIDQVESLVHTLFRSPRSDRRGGYRGTQGRRTLDIAGTHQVCTTLTTEQHAYVLDIGQGDVAVGVRLAVQQAMEAHRDSEA